MEPKFLLNSIAPIEDDCFRFVRTIKWYLLDTLMRHSLRKGSKRCWQMTVDRKGEFDGMSEPYGAMSFLLLVFMSLSLRDWATFGKLGVLRLWGSGFCWVCVKPLIGSVLTMDRGCYKWSRDIIQALIGAQLVGMCLSEHIFTSEFTTETPRPETDAARQGGIAQAGLHLRSRDKQNSSMSECPAQWRSFPHHL